MCNTKLYINSISYGRLYNCLTILYRTSKKCTANSTTHCITSTIYKVSYCTEYTITVPLMTVLVKVQLIIGYYEKKKIFFLTISLQ